MENEVIPSASIYQNSRTPEGNQVLSINHIVFINSLGTVNYSCHRIVETLLISMFKMPDKG